jgi:hypothetical protein
MPPKWEEPDLSRRRFVSLLPGAFAGAAFFPLISSLPNKCQNNKTSPESKVCWLDVCAPFIVNDPEGVQSEILLTSDTFAGVKGYEDGADSTEYEIYLYDAAGKAVGEGGVARRMMVPALHTTRLTIRDVLPKDEKFWGGMRIRLRPKGREPMHATDLFSSAFVRWRTDNSFDNVHANPDPLQWQRPDSFYYSMPFPPLGEYEALFSLFNPYAEASAGTITVYDQLGGKLKDVAYQLPPHASLLFDLRRGDFTATPYAAFAKAPVKERQAGPWLTESGGTVAVTNQTGYQKGFAYLLLKRAGSSIFSIEHPIHQAPFRPRSTPPPFDPAGRFKAKNVLYTPLVFRAKQIGGVTLDSRFHFSSGAPLEEHLWINPFITDSEGNVSWQINPEDALTISAKEVERGVIKLAANQSCILDCAQIPLPKTFSGGMSLAVAPTTNHTLMKVEISVKEWRAQAFTHFRPGLQSARGYQAPRLRGSLATDYVACGARIEKDRSRIVRDEVIGIINIDDQAVVGHPILEVFASGGLVARLSLGDVPSFGCRHYLLSELSSGKIGPQDLTLRLVDERATLLMSVLHLDYLRRDLALDHGSDRFSTFIDYGCDATV